jgi:hypothetical protein
MIETTSAGWTRQRRRLAGVALGLWAMSLAFVPAGGAPTALQSTGGGAAGRNFGGADRCATPSGEIEKAVPWAQQRLAPDRVWPLSRGEGVTVGVVGGHVVAHFYELKRSRTVRPSFE